MFGVQCSGPIQFHAVRAPVVRSRNDHGTLSLVSLQARGKTRKSRFSSMCRSRELHPKPAAFTHVRFDSSLSTHAFRAFPNEREPNARAGVAFGVMQALKQSENPLLMIRSDAYAIVLK